MQNVLLILELVIALALIAVVLMQRSEGAGGLGMSGGGSASGRSPQTALGRVTGWLGMTFFVVAFALTIVEASESGNSSVLDRLTDVPEEAPAAPSDLTTLPGSTEKPATPPASE